MEITSKGYLSSSAAYGVISYETAYLKTYYPVEFMAALITSVMGNTDKVVEYIRECNALNIKVLKPDINKSFAKFSVEDGNIRFGLAAVKNVGVNVINNIVTEREQNGEFTDFVNLIKRLDNKDINKRVIESLIKCGGFDEMGYNRASLLMGYEKVLESVTLERKKNIRGQISLFDGFGESEEINRFENEISSIPNVKEYEEREKLALEKEVLGMYVTGHPLSEYEEELNRKTSINTKKLKELKEDMDKFLAMDQQNVIIGGMISQKRIQTTKRNEIMSFLEVEDLYGTIDVIVFPKILQQYNTIVNEENIVYIKGRLSIQDDNAKIIAEQIKDINDKTSFTQTDKKVYNRQEDEQKLFIKIDDINNKEKLQEIEKILKFYPGKEPVFLCTIVPKKKYKWNGTVNISKFLIDKLKEILDESCIKVVK